MRRASVLLVLLLPLGLRTASADQRVPLAAARPGTPAAVAEKAHALWEDGRRDALRALAAQDDPDPWLVAQEMVLKGWHDAAESFAIAAPRTDTEHLPAYVTSRRDRPTDERALRAVQAMLAAFRRSDWSAALEAGADVSGPQDDVVGLRVVFLKGFAAAQLRRFEAGANHYLEFAAGARALGWLAQAQDAYRRGAETAYQQADWPRALEAWRAQAEVAEERGDEVAAADAVSGVGLACGRMARYEEAFEAFRQVLERRERLGDPRGVAATLGNMGLLHQRRGDWEDARQAHERALERLKDLGDARGVALTLGNIGMLDLLEGRHRRAKERFEHSLLLFESLGETAEAARTLGNLGVAFEHLGELREALDHQHRALALKKALQDRAGVAGTLGNIGNLLLKLGDYPKAQRFQEQALAERKRLPDPVGEARTLGNLAVVYERLGDLEKALRTQKEALELKVAVEDEAGAATTLANIGLLHLGRGDYPNALSTLTEARKRQLAVGDAPGAARTLGSLAVVYRSLGDHERALEILLDVLDDVRARKDAVGEARTLGDLGLVYVGLERHEDARARLEEALEILRRQEDEPGVARTLLDLGITHLQQGATEKALELFEEAREASAALRSDAGVARCIGYQGLAYARQGETDKAIEHLEEAVGEAHRLHLTPLLVFFLGPLAMLRMRAGEPGWALSEALRSLQFLEEILGGLDEEQGAIARAQFADLYGVGALAAAAVDKPADVLTFLESGRASSLLESLEGREALQWENVPEELIQEDAQAAAAERILGNDYRRALEDGRTERVEAYAEELEKARQRREDVRARMYREARRDAELWYPRPATLGVIQTRLVPGQTLVLYGLCIEEALALVVTKQDARIVRLGPVSEVREACEALALDSPEGVPDAALKRLRSILAEPLDLPDDVKQVLLSPEGVLCYVPLAALFPGRAVTLTPSGSVHVHLLEEQRTPGEGVLALGAPIYGRRAGDAADAVYLRDGALARLPWSKEEAEAVGDVLLLEQEANEEELFARVGTRPRWRAVHLACHGLVDPERPMLSALALSRTAGDDGFLTCYDLFRRRIPADLVVLSACNTARGRIVHGEGIVGLMRAFMYAGAPRVLCSLWRVDDRATLVLMKKFYELWNPKDGSARLPAAEALRRAQAFVRDQEGWSHPYFWAAWVLWGLPD